MCLSTFVNASEVFPLCHFLFSLSLPLIWCWCWCHHICCFMHFCVLYLYLYVLVFFLSFSCRLHQCAAYLENFDRTLNQVYYGCCRLCTHTHLHCTRTKVLTFIKIEFSEFFDVIHISATIFLFLFLILLYGDVVPFHFSSSFSFISHHIFFPFVV